MHLYLSFTPFHYTKAWTSFKNPAQGSHRQRGERGHYIGMMIVERDTAARAASVCDCTTLVELLRQRATHQPDRLAYTFLLDGETTEATLTYAQLDQRARTIAAHLQSLAAPGARALLLFPPSLDYITAFFACLYAGLVAVPAYPPRLNRSLTRIQTIVADAQATLALTSSSLLPKITATFSQAPDLQALHWLATDTLPADAAPAWQMPPLSGTSLAFLQYTSGSTGTPKGVMVSHDNLMHNSELIRQCFEHTAESVGVIWLPPYHDMGLIGGIIQPLYVGFPVVLLSPTAFLQRPLRWLQAISRYHATTSGGPNFAFDLCVRKIPPHLRASLDLRSWDLAFNGAEPIRPDTLDRFAAAFAPAGFRPQAFYPCYGLAEATLLVSGGAKASPPTRFTVRRPALEQHQVCPADPTQPGAQTLVSCGWTRPGQHLLIVDPDSGQPCPPDTVGEIWLAGPSIAQGYWNRPAETAQTFQARLADSGAGPFLRTGDLGFLHEGELYVTGRQKDLIIIRGTNHYPQDIELTVERSHPALRPNAGAAFAVEVAGAERLVVVQEVEGHQPPDTEAIASVVRQAVFAEHEVQLYALVLVKQGSIPKTSSGKIQRHACRADFLAGRLEVVGSSIIKLLPEQERQTHRARGQSTTHTDDR
jgi:acyl-CoA synthetase (AMP-forming)/AMP-acid ligase II